MTAVIGLDFGTESARALVVDVHDGRILGSGVAPYRHGVIDEQLPSTGVALGAEWALQDPGDWLEAMETSVREALARAGVAAADVVGLGIDFTSCTVLPVTSVGVARTTLFADTESLLPPSRETWKEPSFCR